MKRTEVAFYSLLASALIIGALVMVKASQFTHSNAYAEMNVSKGSVSVLSTSINSSAPEEMLFVLDSQNGTLLGYLVQPSRTRIELMATLDVASLIEQGLAQGAAGGNTPRRTR
jgi:hypothetical protein